MKENKANIKGDGNTVFQDTRKSKINIGKDKEKKRIDTYQIIGIVIGLLALITSIVVGWDEIKNFFDI